MNPQITIEMASVKVMRSHDFCHFEVALSSTLAKTTDQVDELRKTAARLADRAVEQYKVAKANLEKTEAEKYEDERRIERLARIETIHETERTPEQQAYLKDYKDKAYSARRYDYEDDWDDIYKV